MNLPVSSITAESNEPDSDEDEDQLEEEEQEDEIKEMTINQVF
jgi:hypothetical protein